MTLLTPSLSFICQFRSRVTGTCVSRLQNLVPVPNNFIHTGGMRTRTRTTNNGLHMDSDDDERTSVTGMIYEAKDTDSDEKIHPVVQLYTKEGCTLCDKTKDVLQLLREEQPHSLEAIDITDPDKTEFFDKYKWDIPVLHINDLYWTKHRLSADETVKALDEARAGNFEVQRGEPNAAAMEQKMEERKAKDS